MVGGSRRIWVVDGIVKRAIRLATPHGINIFAAIILSFAVLILVGFVLLMLPSANASAEWTEPLTALFTATSAVSDTGLVVVDTGTHWSRFGQAVILALIQIGGLGFMVVSSFLLLMASRRIVFRDFRVADALGAHNAREFAWLALWTLAFTVVLEAVGTGLLAIWLREEGTVGYPWWAATFHTISAVNNAGFDTIGDGASLARYASHGRVLSVIAGLSFIGAIGAPVSIGLLGLVRGGRLRVNSGLALTTTLLLVGVGTLFIFLTELHNAATLGQLDMPDKLMNSFFTSVTSRTAGFSSLNMGDLELQTLFVIMILMFIGGVSGSTAGGIKVNTFSVLLLTALSYIRGRRRVDITHRRIPETQVHKAVAVAFFGSTLALVVALVLSSMERMPFVDLLFETVSAFGTVGFSTGITSSFSAAGLLFLSATMFLGRLGPITVALALSESREVQEEEWPEADVTVG